MTKKSTAILLSFLVAVMPFLGFPAAFDKYFYLLAGLVLAGLIELASIQYCSKCGTLIQSPVDEALDRYEDPAPEEDMLVVENGEGSIEEVILIREGTIEEEAQSMRRRRVSDIGD